MNYKKNRFIYNFELIIIKPFVYIGTTLSKFYKIKGDFDNLILTPNADIGGSIQVNADIAQCLKGKTLIIFTKKHKNNGYINKFKNKQNRILDISNYIDNKYLHFVNIIFRGIIKGWIKQNNIKNIIGGECIYFYKIIPHIPDIYKVIEVCHVDNWLNYSIRFINDVNFRVFSTSFIKNKVIQQYNNESIPRKYHEKLIHVENCIDAPESISINNDKKLRVYFIGRGSAQKRVHLACQIAERIYEINKNIEFNFIGDQSKIIDPSKYPFINFYNNIDNEKEMQSHFVRSDVLLMTSKFEGLPLTIMHMMSYGKIIVSTAVSAIPNYIKNEINGFLINSTEEDEIVKEGVSILLNIFEHPEIKMSIGRNNFEFAKENFNRIMFCKKYNSLISQ